MSNLRQVEVLFQSVQLAVGLVGIFGNGLTYGVFLRRAFAKYSFAFYYRTMSLVNIVILANTFGEWSRLVLGVDVNTLSWWLCKLYVYEIYVASSVSVWLLSLISIDRLVVIAYHNQYRILKKRWFQTTLVLLVVLFSLLIHVRIPLNFEWRYKENATPICYWPPHIIEELSWIYFFNTFFVNIVINNILNVKLILFVLSTWKNNIVNLRQQRLVKKQQRLTISLISLNLLSFLFNMPLAIIIFSFRYFDFKSSAYQIALAIAFNIALIDNVAPFFINMCLNELFYKEFLSMIKLRK